ncbi:rhodanese-like domain-containing protein [Cohnella sp. LGH]|uniref:rhodanese-like domain-containing protein n=1 Tax=Cohnella sp. LGH TaxID=1619153 RepID=UPI001ADCDE41|nr:rhodanese-like domain-containing protein [Cohnella sp. LGH]QTH40976.1 rhodanese-like domain-containing protein [Cohnella sp. LGH]
MDSALYILLSLIVLWLFYRKFTPVKGLRTLTPEQFQSESKGNRVIDVREIHEYKRGHIKGAENVPLSQLQQRLGDIPKESTVFLYCQSGMRSKQAAKLLGRNGYTGTVHLRGGMMSWSGPTEK